MTAPGRLVVAAVLVALLGCGGDPDPDCEALAAELPTLVLGGTTSALDGFVALDDGDDLKVIINGKGLFTLPPSLRIAGLYPGVAERVGDAEDPEVAIRAYVGEAHVGGTDVSVDDGSILADLPHYGFVATPDGGELIAVPVIFVDGIEPLDYLNQVVTLEATVTDACSRSAVDPLEVVAFWQY